MPYYNQYSPYLYQQGNTWNNPQQPIQMMNQPKQESVVRVTGEDGAKAYQMLPNSSVLLLDERDAIVWLKTTDGAGYPSVTGYRISPIEKEQPASQEIVMSDYEDLDRRIKALEERIDKAIENGKSDTRFNKQANRKSESI